MHLQQLTALQSDENQTVAMCHEMMPVAARTGQLQLAASAVQQMCAVLRPRILAHLACPNNMPGVATDLEL